jgi:Cdc6-like AAA superfamily ATPase
MSIKIVKRGRPSKADLQARQENKPKPRSDSQILTDLKERFDILSLLTKGAVAENIRAMVVTGAPGVGKTYTDS